MTQPSRETAHQIEGNTPDDGPPRGVIPGCPHLLERDAALGTLAQAIARARDGTGCAMLVSGEQGIGRTALLRQAAKALSHADRVAWGRCEDLVLPRPLAAVRDIARDLGGGLLALIDSGPALIESILDAVAEQQLNRDTGCTLLVIDDLHWADDPTLDLVVCLARRIAALPAVLVLSHRDSGGGPVPRLRRLLGALPLGEVPRIALQPLSPAGVTELAARHGQAADGLFAATGGNPLCLTALLEASAATLADASQAAPQPRALALPPGLRDALREHLAVLDAAQRELLDALCVFDAPVEWWLAQALLAPAAQAAVDDAVAQGWLVVRGGALSFRIGLQRLATREALAPIQRLRRHAAALAALSHPPPGVAAPSASRLLPHAEQAGDAAQVLLLAPRAADESARAGAHRQAAQQWAMALRFETSATLEQRAQLWEQWSAEAALGALTERVIDARRHAVDLWRQLGRADAVARNLCALSRLEWLRGDGLGAARSLSQALSTVAALPPGPATAWAFALRAQQAERSGRTDAALDWGRLAVDLARQLGRSEVESHALTTLGGAQLWAGRADGERRLAQSLQIALAGGHHEQAARAQRTRAEHALLVRGHDHADALLAEGIADARRHDIDIGVLDLEGCLARLRLQQGRLDDAMQIAQSVLARAGAAAALRVPALTVQACVQMRRGAAGATALLQHALDLAERTGDARLTVPLVLALVEQAWLRADLPACRAALTRFEGPDGPGGLAGTDLHPWHAAAVAVWRQRAGEPRGAAAAAHAAADYPEPYALELQGDAQQAAARWLALGQPGEAALALLQPHPQAGSAATLLKALQCFESAGAQAGAARVRALARAQGCPQALPRPRRGPYARAREHKWGLTGREQQMLALLADGLRNTDIAHQLGLSLRTVEHHVSAVLAKLGVIDRGAAADLARREGLSGGDAGDPRSIRDRTRKLTVTTQDSAARGV